MIGVRSAVLMLTRGGSPLRFEIYPMVHIGEPAFYAAVAERLRRCDLIVAEGVGRPAPCDRGSASGTRTGSAAVSALTASYRLPAWFARSGLTEQHIEYATLGVPVIGPDMSREQFTAGWNRVPLWQRALAVTAAPLVGLHWLAAGSRRELARHLNLDDGDWQERMADVESLEELEDLLGEQRDRLLIAELDRIHRQRHHEAIKVAVVYGAHHVPPLIHAMRALHGYRVRGAEWLMVFGFEE